MTTLLVTMDGSRREIRDAAHRRCAVQPFSVSRGLMRDAALPARRFGSSHPVHLHTPLAENDSDFACRRENVGCTPAEYAEQLGRVGPDVWHAQWAKLDEAGMAAGRRTS